MPITDETISAVRDALERARGLDASRIQVDAEGDRVVIRGSVPADHQVDVATTLAEAHAPDVRTALSVDPGLREDAAGSGEVADDPSDEAAARSDPDAGEDPVRPSRRDTASPGLTSQSSEFRPQPVSEDLTEDEDLALSENLAWDPPDAPHSAPTGSEQRGIAPRETDAEPPTDEDPDPADEDPSLADLSSAELARDARPEGAASQERDETNRDQEGA